MINAIVAVSQSWGIGKDNDSLYHIPMDLAYFREMTLGSTIIVGRCTLLSFPDGMPLKDRRNIVLSSKEDYKVQGAQVAHSVSEALELCPEGERVFVVGGGMVYKNFLPHCNNIYVTHIEANPPADCFFPNLKEDSNWKLSERSQMFCHDGIEFCFARYENLSLKNEL